MCISIFKLNDAIPNSKCTSVMYITNILDGKRMSNIDCVVFLYILNLYDPPYINMAQSYSICDKQAHVHTYNIEIPQFGMRIARMQE